MDHTGSDKPRIPDKFYFKIGEATELTGLESYVLRFWETEFSNISPKRTSSGQRLYRKSDIESILKVKHLLYDKRFTIQGAKQYLKERESKRNNHSTLSTADLNEIRSMLNEIRNMLD